ncbi:sigma-70 family RNA polymerase sigma factor [Synoicihabitans lomoniglobus]|uniref:Sigma-70 family RNA polymerase sigma factor n=1 Tax=Synoicihabitans lomoniglobus TaxID=2909285 RepID=A0AAF0CHJ7_9BACT|nr:sigma-70 family RNA polymerase sigma factor [Opitutaceae bacterium LMO-M01]
MITPSTLCPAPPSASHAPPDPVALLDLVDRALAGIAPRLPAHVDRDDLASAGREALIHATKRFNGPTADARAFCFVRVRGAMLDELRRLDPLARRRRERARAVSKSEHELTHELGRSPSTFEIAEALNLSLPEVHAAQADLAAEEAGAPILDENHADPMSPCPAATAEGGDLMGQLIDALDRLPPKQAYAVRRYHLEDATLDTIGGELGVSRERARQLRAAGETRLRADLAVLTLWDALLP